MPGLHLYTSNRIELLADRLAEILSREPPPPMTPEIIVIPSGGMERFIAFKLADKQQICANTEFPFPNAFINQIFRKVFPDITQRSIFDQEMLTWKIMELLPSFLGRKEFKQIKQYVSHDPTQVKLFELCRKIACLFDQYTVFRPEMIREWEAGKESSSPDEQWQAQLWRRIVETAPGDNNHRASLRTKLSLELKKDNRCADILPTRVSIFGITFLPGFHLDILGILSRHMDINLFSLNPCKQFWEDIISEKYMAKKSVEQLQQKRDIELQHYETGNSLLASLGTYGREFLYLLQGMECIEQSDFIKPDEKSMLAMLQSDILNLHTRETPTDVPVQDRSIQIQLCHSPLREIEVLHDNILHFFEQDPQLTPNDIVVMIPDIETYAPFIQTVFDTASSSLPHIPYSIADMAIRSSCRIINDFFSILDLKKNRFSASSVLSVLESEAIRNRSGLHEDDVSIIHDWVDAANIRWGINEQDRKRAGMPSLSQNTWEAGLDRLMLGYAMSADNDSFFSGILPYKAIEGSGALPLGKFHSFLQTLFDFVNKLDSERTLDQWAKLLLKTVDNLFTPPEADEHYFHTLRSAIADLSEQGRIAEFNRKIPFAVIRSHLDSCLSENEYGKGYIVGGVTFCTMLPMRSVPFKIICLVGMNDGSIPRTDSSVSFDLIASNQRPGDRSVRKEDRYCFLESILSARRTLYISYTGHDIRDNSIIPPSVLVSELTDYLSGSFAVSSSGKASIIDHITTNHRLNAFSKEYFLDRPDNIQNLFSYSSENAEAAQAQLSEREPFITAPVPPPGEDGLKRITINELCSFFVHPVKFFLKKRLGIIPEEAHSIINDIEPFSIDGLERYQMQQELLNKRLSGGSIAEQYNTIQAAGILPYGHFGLCSYNRICEDIDKFASSLIAENIVFAEKTFDDIEITHAGVTITGRISTLTRDNLIHYRPAGIKAKDRLRIWISHLILNLSNDDALPRTSMLFGKDGKGKTQCVTYTNPGNAEAHLDTLLGLYQEGMTRPIAFYPESSLSYADEINKGKNHEQAIKKALETWAGAFRHKESDDIYYRIFPGETDSFDSDFTAIAQKIYLPILINEQQAKK